ncbi:MAG: CFI-box-CTERM domain-containing protein [Myxococcales bacterium]|nr:CFI-box-CTERM domain-containing protein [Myxococcales bacterium]
MISSLACLLASPGALAQPPEPRERLVTVEMTPTARAQIAVWAESADGRRFATLLLTAATGTRGIANRPGATQMNSGFRWPYGRRLGVLPVWAHRRLAAGAEPFPQVVFQSRIEGHASRSTDDYSVDHYYCLSFNVERSRREWLDAVSCASVFNSDKGRYLTERDVAAGYAEPFERDGRAMMRRLDIGSPYPPRRDVHRCDSSGCYDHPDVARFAEDARRRMPEIDAVTRATPPGEAPLEIVWEVPSDWPAGTTHLYVEVNTEGDYNANWNDTRMPTPSGPTGQWDYWALNYGYPYRGQPSVVWRLDLDLERAGRAAVAAPVGYGDVDGLDGRIRPMDGTISDDPAAHPGSGADRLRHGPDGSRVRAQVVVTRLCESAEPPPECSMRCDAETACPTGFLCGPEGRCVGMCDLDAPPGVIEQFEVRPHRDVKQSHHWAHLSFLVPASLRPVRRYDVRVATHPIVDEESFMRAMPAQAATIDSVELRVPTDGAAGSRVEIDFGGLVPQTRYFVGMRAVDACNDAGPIATAELTTTEIHFTTVSPCFVATAAYGSPLDARIGVLRRLRDRHLAPTAPGRALIGLYETVGPHLAALVASHPSLRSVARSLLEPVVAIAEELLDAPPPGS